MSAYNTQKFPEKNAKEDLILCIFPVLNEKQCWLHVKSIKFFENSEYVNMHAAH